MKLPFPIRGTQEWDDREYQRYLMGKHVLCFGPVPIEEDVRNKHHPVRMRIQFYLEQYGEDPDTIADYMARTYSKS